MNPATIKGIAYLLASAVEAGVKISAILKEAKATGVVSDETWDGILQDIARAEQEWENNA